MISEADKEKQSGIGDINDDDDGEFVKFLQIPDNVLPNHFRCASHTLCLVSSRDAIEKGKEQKYDDVYKIRCNSAFSKLNALCGKANKPKSSEIIFDSLKCAIKTPCKTRWNSLFDCIQQLLKFKTEALNEVMEKLELAPFSSEDVEFLKEYLAVTYPIAIGIDDLQSNDYYAFFMPRLHNIKYELKVLESNELQHCAPLLKQVSDGFFRRFKRFFDFDNDQCTAAVIATCTHPYFKLRWLHKEYYTTEVIKKIESKLVEAAMEIYQAQEKIQSKPVSTLSSKHRLNL